MHIGKDMLSKNLIKFVNQLGKKKYRDLNNSFVVEGVKSVELVLNSHLIVNHLFHTNEFKLINNNLKNAIEVNPGQLKKISFLSTPNKVLAIVKKPQPKELKFNKELYIALDDIKDPGNLGTIIRLANWFGVKNIICSENCVDVYNPKVIQASMGAFLGINITYTNLEKVLNNYNGNIFGTYLNGNNIFNEKLKPEGIIVFGNEAKGINPKLEACIKNKLTIPAFAENKYLESLNVATATAITLGQFLANK